MGHNVKILGSRTRFGVNSTHLNIQDDHFSWLKISVLLVKNEHFNRTSTSKNKLKLFENKK